MYFIMLPFVILGSFAKLANKKIQEKINYSRKELTSPGVSSIGNQQKSKKRQLQKIS